MLILRLTYEDGTVTERSASIPTWICTFHKIKLVEIIEKDVPSDDALWIGLIGDKTNAAS